MNTIDCGKPMQSIAVFTKTSGMQGKLSIFVPVACFEYPNAFLASASAMISKQDMVHWYGNLNFHAPDSSPIEQ